MAEPSKGLPSWVVDAVAVAALSSLAWAVAAALTGRTVLDTDAVNLAFAIERFDVLAHQPHPPGYLGYVLILRAVHALAGLAPLDTVTLTARLFTVATVALTYAAARRLAPADRTAHLLAAALAATSPLVLYYAVDGQTHAAEGAVGAALLWGLALPADPSPRSSAAQGYRRAVAVGLLLALGGSLRPSFALIAVGPVLWRYIRRPRELVLLGTVAAVGTVAWLVPTVLLSGGWTAYRAASDALIGAFAGSTSLLSEQGDRRMVSDNLTALFSWAGLALAAALAAASISSWQPACRRAYGLLLAMSLPALAFYAVVFVAEPGYLLGLVPAAAVAAGVSLGTDGPRRALRRGAGGALAIGHLILFVTLPSGASDSRWWAPSVEEIAFRQHSAELFAERVSAGAEPGQRLLVVSDLGPTALMRQLPLLRPNTHALIVYSSRAALFDSTTLALATEDDWLAAPGPALLSPGPPTELRAPHSYDALVLGPTYSAELRDELAAQTDCDVPPPSPDLTAPHLPMAGCFPSGQLRIAPHTIRWADTN